MFQAGAVPPAEAAAQREGEEQRARGAAEAYKHSQMEATGGERSVCAIDCHCCSLPHSDKADHFTCCKWLQGSDPGKYKLIQKIQSLQKRLITKTQELEERELLLQVNILNLTNLSMPLYTHVFSH